MNSDGSRDGMGQMAQTGGEGGLEEGSRDGVMVKGGLGLVEREEKEDDDDDKDEEDDDDGEFEDVPLEDLEAIEANLPELSPPSGPPPPPRPAPALLANRPMNRQDLLYHEHQRQAQLLKRRIEVGEMYDAGFEMVEAVVTDGETLLSDDRRFVRFRVVEPSPLRRCWQAAETTKNFAIVADSEEEVEEAEKAEEGEGEGEWEMF
ncbi:hypothetical protein G7Y89_g2586 [Cudoniella acicularis]|uniref:Uncharacterized protein n=1 Tax=Cudoniella acicularis TaxID=354080 RepID=A0A8H4RT37_9HELO|nr:hypothetical protein G7Y89_g2586 [Cudoniella acicularis]